MQTLVSDIKREIGTSCAIATEDSRPLAGASTWGLVGIYISFCL